MRILKVALEATLPGWLVIATVKSSDWPHSAAAPTEIRKGEPKSVPCAATAPIMDVPFKTVTPGVDEESTATADVMFLEAFRHGLNIVGVSRIASPASILPLLLPRLSLTATLCTSRCGKENDSLMPV